MATKEKARNKEEPISLEFNNNNIIIKNCFVITPIGGENDPIRRHIDGIYDAAIVPVLEQFDYTPEIPHRMSMPGSINKQIIKKIYDSNLIIANLTEINPNVMYELALRHCFNKPAIIIAEDGTQLPFDINNERTIFYKNDAQGILDLKAELHKTIEKIQGTEAKKYSSPVVSVLGELKIEEQLLERKNGTQDDNFLDSLQLILRRLDRIEYDTRKSLNNNRISEIQSEKRMYRILAPISSLHDFETALKQFISVFKENGINFRGRFIDDTTYLLTFNQLNPENANFVDTELRAFCNVFDFNFERII